MEKTKQEVHGIRRNAFNCEKYVSGKSMDEVMSDYGLTNVIKLGSNENPYAPYPKAIEVMKSEINKINMYPEKNYIRLKELVGEKYGLDENWVSLGHGAGNVLDVVAKTLLEEGDEVIVPKQSYRLYREISKIMGAKVIEVPLNEDYTIDLEDFEKALTPKTKIVWICNPNNPTGTVIDKKTFSKFIDAMPENCWMVLDEAYVEFADEKLMPNIANDIKAGKQIINIHTFSKYYGLAGARIGYLVANPEFINWYDTVSEPFNANRIGLGAAVALLENNSDCKKYGDILINERKKLNEELTNLGCKCIDSQANFVFFSTPYDANEISELLLNKGVIVRPCGGWGYNHHLRISIGTKEENELFIKEFSDVINVLKTKTN